MSVSRTGTSRISSGSASTLRVGSVRPRAARRHFHQLNVCGLSPSAAANAAAVSPLFSHAFTSSAHCARLRRVTTIF